MKKNTYIDLSGMTFNNVMIKSYNHSNKQGSFWNCVCSCGKEFIGRGAALKSGHTTSCGCVGLKRLGESRLTHGLSTTPEYKTWKDAKSRAKIRNRPFNIAPTDIIVPDKCPLLGIDIIRSEGKLTDNSPSLDCFDPEKGYVKGNIWVISQKANSIKRNLSLEEWRVFVNRLEENSERFTKS